MLKYSFLGHQTWSVQSEDYHLIIDPVLCPYFRNSAYAKSWVHPPRGIPDSAVASIDGIYISHDHEDHFHIESLHRLRRDVDVYISGNMSGAAERILKEMGFENVTRVFAMESLRLGSEIKITFFPPPASPTEHWVLQPYVMGLNHRDSLLNPVDCSVSPQFLKIVSKQKIRRLGLVCLANNTQIVQSVYHPTRFFPQKRTVMSNFLPASVLNCHFGFGDLPLMDCLAIVGAGFIDEANPFGVYKNQSQHDLGQILQKYSFDETAIHGLVPGDVFQFDGVKMAKLSERSPLVERHPDAERVFSEAQEKDFRHDPLHYEYPPITGREEVTEEELRRLEKHLAEFSIRMNSHRFGMELLNTNLSSDGQPYREGRLLLILLAKGERIFYEYCPALPAFRRVDFAGIPIPDLRDRYPHGYECWATDLLGVFESDLSHFQLILFRNRVWAPTQGTHDNVNFGITLNDLFAPECTPEITYNLYRKAYERCLKEPALT